MIANMLKIVLGAVLVAGLLLAPIARSLGDKKSIVQDKKWTAQDLSSMAKTSTMADAVSVLTSAVQETGAPVPQLDEISALIDAKAPAELRAALLMATNVKGKGKTKWDMKIADFAGAVTPAATCATEDTAGGHGIHVCVAGCEQRSKVLAWDSRKGACHMLCSVATSPCRKGSFAYRAMIKSWRKSIYMTLMIVPATTFFSVKVVILLAASLVYQLHLKPVTINTMRAHTRKTERRLALERRDARRTKAAVLTRLHGRLHQRRALHICQDFVAHASYRASQEAAAKAKAMALQAAIDAVAAERDTAGKGAGACVLS